MPDASDLPPPTGDSGGSSEGDAALLVRERFWRNIADAQGETGPTLPGLPVSSPVVNRRRFMQVMGASLALAGSAGCSRTPLEHIVPYRDGPAQQTYGKPVFYATALPRDGFGVGVLVETQMGRPTKIEGNVNHPQSLGATDVFMQAAVLDLWDPDRSQVVRNGRNIASWPDFLSAMQDRLRIAARRGSGLRLLTETITSPSVHAQIVALLQRYPGARWHQWQPVNRDNCHAGSQLAYGARLETLYRFDRARTVLALDADFLDDHPGFVRHALDFSVTRNAHAAIASRSRVYAVASTPTLTAANADHRWPVRCSDVPAALQQVAHALGVGPAPQGNPVLPQPWVDAVTADLMHSRGASIVVAGHRQPPEVHALVHALNEQLGNVGTTVVHVPCAAAEPVDHLASLRELTQAMHDGQVESLVLSGTNPVYTAPADLDFGAALQKVAFKVHHGLYQDETGRSCDWHVPDAHPLEAWGDVRSVDGTLSLRQPCIAPLYDGHSDLELLGALNGDLASSGRDLLLAFWRTQRPDDFDAFLDSALRTGVVANSASAPVSSRLRSEPQSFAMATTAPARASASSVPSAGAAPRATDIELVFVPDSRMHDGRHANNAWLQELPKTLSQLTWSNAAMLSPALANRLGVGNEDMLELRVGERSVAAPAWVMPGMPDNSVTLALGYGRSAAGKVGNGRGVDAYRLRTTAAPWVARGVTVSRTGKRQPLACVQTHHSMEGRDIVRSYAAAHAADCTPKECGTPGFREQRTLYDSPPTGPYAWAMSIDLAACIGCSACTIACQAENNIPVVGPDEVRNGREMHWIRVDRYWEGGVDDPNTLFQPVPCMQCEHAPCEVVCPVEASVHDAQGINVQVYNRCVGTRFCSNNCPYKVRRFNFLSYSQDVPGLNAQRNPEVTVRMRGVMEKCNYCLQRITTAKIGADREGRRLRDGEVVTACQAVCPTRAIVFGDLADAGSEVNRHKDSPLSYALLAELNTRPRTTYLARVTNAEPGLAPHVSSAAFDAAPQAAMNEPGSSGRAPPSGDHALDGAPHAAVSPSRSSGQASPASARGSDEH